MSHDFDYSPRYIDADSAHEIAEFMHGFAHPIRVQILGILRHKPMNVSELIDELHVEQSALSHQLKMLRDLGLVTANRLGRNIYYDVHDEHVAQLIDQAIHHIAHRALGMTRTPQPDDAALS